MFWKTAENKETRFTKWRLFLCWFSPISSIACGPASCWGRCEGLGSDTACRVKPLGVSPSQLPLHGCCPDSAQGALPTPDSLNGLGFAQLRKEQEWAPSGRDALFPSGVLPRGAGWFVRSGGSGQNICHPHPKCLSPFKAARSEMKCFIFWYCSLKRK